MNQPLLADGRPFAAPHKHDSDHGLLTPGKLAA